MYPVRNNSFLELVTLSEPENEFDISQLDFSPLGVIVSKIDSQFFTDKIRLYSERENDENVFHYNYRMFNNMLEKAYKQTPYVVVPIDDISIQEDYSDLNWMLQLPYHILQVICPSRFYISSQHTFQVIGENKLHEQARVTEYLDKSFGSYPESKFHIDNIEAANELIALFQQMKNNKPFKVGLSIFLSSFDMSHYSMQFLNIIMAFESLIHGPQELSYRLKRGIAILCGGNTESCTNIFKNLSKSYNLRSKIAHGEEFDTNKINEYLPYLINLGASYLQELLWQRVDDKEMLNSKLTQLGYGQRNQIFEGYTQKILNQLNHNLIQSYKLS